MYDIIKHQNGERFARAMRNYGLLDVKDIADIVRYAGSEPCDALMEYMWQLFIKSPENETHIGNPFELLYRAGYEDVYHVKTMEQLNSIAKYFRDDEKLCSFNSNRLEQRYVVHALKRNVDDVRPARHPHRQDEYGTSVISIQIDKKTARIIITNRYNYTVASPDNTFDGNPDNIIPGLTNALKKYFNIPIVDIQLPSNYILYQNKYFVKYKPEFKTAYSIVGDGVYMRDNKLCTINKNTQVLMDNFILDLSQHRLFDISLLSDGFTNAFNKEIAGKKLTVSGRAPNQTILADNVSIVRLRDGEIVFLYLPSMTDMGDGFMRANTKCEILDVPNCKRVGRYCLTNNTSMRYMNLRRVNFIGENFMYSNNSLDKQILYDCEHIDRGCFANNKVMRSFYAPKCGFIGSNTLADNTVLDDVTVPRDARLGTNVAPAIVAERNAPHNEPVMDFISRAR